MCLNLEYSIVLYFFEPIPYIDIVLTLFISNEQSFKNLIEKGYFQLSREMRIKLSKLKCGNICPRSLRDTKITQIYNTEFSSKWSKLEYFFTLFENLEEFGKFLILPSTISVTRFWFFFTLFATKFCDFVRRKDIHATFSKI